jgi:cell division protein ZapA (FtsZ GTPase activity inhibitor)
MLDQKHIIRIEIDSEQANQLFEATNSVILKLLELKEQSPKLNQEAENRLVNIEQRLELISRKLNDLAIVVGLKNS